MIRPTRTVLVIDDERQIRRFLRAGFELHGFAVIEAENAAAGLKAATFNPPDLVVLDLQLPDLSGAEVLEQIRSWSNVPIIILSIESHEEEKARLLRLGADDYVVKPFGMSELLARSDAVLRRYLRSSEIEPVVKAGALSIDLLSRAVLLEGNHVKLTRKEFHLLHVLAKHSGLVVTHQQLLKEIWGNHKINIQYLRILMRKLRQKIEPDPTRPSIIVTESGIGYRLHTKSEAVPRPSRISSD
jgi:two-component system, OmpR family, KDP operon response regulator KdpE